MLYIQTEFVTKIASNYVQNPTKVTSTTNSKKNEANSDLIRFWGRTAKFSKKIHLTLNFIFLWLSIMICVNTFSHLFAFFSKQKIKQRKQTKKNPCI